MTKLCKIHGKIRYTSMGNDGFDVSCVYASWVDNLSVFDVEADKHYDWWDTDEWRKKRSKGRTK